MLDKTKINSEKIKDHRPTTDGCLLMQYENGHLDPVHQHEDGWYFCDETWAHEHGPYESTEMCREGCMEYAKLLYCDDAGGVPLMYLLGIGEGPGQRRKV